MFRLLCALCVLCGELFLFGCSHPAKFDPSSLTFLVEANPVNLDPRFATDGQSQRLDGLIFSSLLARDAQMNLHGDLAESWSTPDPLTYVFHLKPNVKFHEGRPLTSADALRILSLEPYPFRCRHRSRKCIVGLFVKSSAQIADAH